MSAAPRATRPSDRERTCSICGSPVSTYDELCALRCFALTEEQRDAMTTDQLAEHLARAAGQEMEP